MLNAFDFYSLQQLNILSCTLFQEKRQRPSLAGRRLDYVVSCSAGWKSNSSDVASNGRIYIRLMSIVSFCRRYGYDRPRFYCKQLCRNASLPSFVEILPQWGPDFAILSRDFGFVISEISDLLYPSSLVGRTGIWKGSNSSGALEAGADYRPVVTGSQ